LYEALLELESDPELGDLNDRKIEHRTVFHDSNGAHTTIFELRFAESSLADRDSWQLFLDSGAFNLKLTRLGARPDFDVFTEIANPADQDKYVHDHWRTIFYASFEIETLPSHKKIKLENAALRLFSDVAAKNSTKAQDLKAILEDASAG